MINSMAIARYLYLDITCHLQDLDVDHPWTSWSVFISELQSVQFSPPFLPHSMHDLHASPTFVAHLHLDRRKAPGVTDQKVLIEACTSDGHHPAFWWGMALHGTWFHKWQSRTFRCFGDRNVLFCGIWEKFQSQTFFLRLEAGIDLVKWHWRVVIWICVSSTISLLTQLRFG